MFTYISSNGTEFAFSNALDANGNSFKNTNNPFNNNELMVHHEDGINLVRYAKVNESGRIHCKFGILLMQMELGIILLEIILGGCDARYGTGNSDTMTVYFKTISDYDYHRARW